MLLNQPTLRRIRDGNVSLQFRRWKRPTVKAGGTLLTSIGQLSIHAVDAVKVSEISEADAVDAGFPDRGSLLAALKRARTGTIYRIRLSFGGADPRIALRDAIPDEAEIQDILERLGRLDARAPGGPWTRAVLEVIARHPSTRAAELAEEVGCERMRFKANVRKLKGMGLTESLKVGYRLSPRGAEVFRRHKRRRGGSR